MKTLALLLIGCLAGVTLDAQARKDTIEGVRNFTIVDATVGCAGATESTAIPAIAARGYKAIISLRLATEAGAAIDESRAAAEKAGLKYIHLPLSPSAPEASVADAFIAAVTDKANQPVFIHCAAGGRVGALWLTKRVLVDKWDQAKALEEAKLIGLASPGLEKFALDYIASKKK